MLMHEELLVSVAQRSVSRQLLASGVPRHHAAFGQPVGCSRHTSYDEPMPDPAGSPAEQYAMRLAQQQAAAAAEGHLAAAAAAQQGGFSGLHPHHQQAFLAAQVPFKCCT